MRRLVVLLVASSALLFLASGAIFVQMAAALRERLVERARAEARWEASRLAHGDDATGGGACTSGVLYSGTQATEAPADLRPALAALLEDPRARRAEGALGRWHGDPLVVASVDGGRGGAPAWAAVSVRPPEELLAWRTVMIVLALVTASIVAVSILSSVRMRRDVDTLREGLRLADMERVGRPKTREMAELAASVRALMDRLEVSRRAESELEDALATEKRLSSLGRVVVGLAHEVRNPLAAIRARVETLIARDVDRGSASALEAVAEEVARLDELVDRLLSVSRVSGDRTEVDLAELAEDRAGALRAWAETRGVRVSVIGTGQARVDVRSMERVVDNLVRNAVEASGHDGEVVLRVDAAERGTVLTVEDRGPGVPGAIVESLFEPFVTTKPSGTGLGLALSRTIVESHGGRLTYERRDGCTRFCVSLPGGAS